MTDTTTPGVHSDRQRDGDRYAKELQLHRILICRFFKFQVKQHEFREQFRTETIFKIIVEEPYKLIDKVSTGTCFTAYSTREVF